MWAYLPFSPPPPPPPPPTPSRVTETMQYFPSVSEPEPHRGQALPCAGTGSACAEVAPVSISNGTTSTSGRIRERRVMPLSVHWGSVNRNSPIG
jgi:hypothetical protein